VKVVSPWAYELELGNRMRIHPVQHVSLLDLVDEDPLPGQVIPPPPPVEVDEEPEYQAEEVLDARTRYKKLEYLVKWIGYDEPTWEPATLVNKLQVIDDFHRRYPHKPGPLPEDPN
jgi:Chromo (CHRromatin Organisation MOdifier) domain